MIYLFPGFRLGMVNKDYQSMLGKRFRDMAAIIKNFYKEPGGLWKRRPPSIPLTDTQIPEIARVNMLDYYKTKGGVEYAISQNVQTSWGLAGETRIYCRNGTIHALNINEQTMRLYSVSGSVATLVRSQNFQGEKEFVDRFVVEEDRVFVAQFGVLMEIKENELATKYGGDILFDITPKLSNLPGGSDTLAGRLVDLPVQTDKIKVRSIKQFDSNLENPTNHTVRTINLETTDSDYKSESISRATLYPQMTLVDAFYSPPQTGRGVLYGSGNIPLSPLKYSDHAQTLVKTNNLLDSTSISPLHEIIRSTVLPKLKSFVHYSKNSNGTYSIVPDIKLVSKENPDIPELCNKVYEDENWVIMSVPTGSAFNSLQRYASPDGSTDTKYEGIPDSAKADVPPNQGDIGLETEKNIRRAEQDDATQDQIDLAEQQAKISGPDARRLKSWAYTISPQTDEDFPAGSGSTLNMGLGIALIVRPKMNAQTLKTNDFDVGDGTKNFDPFLNQTDGAGPITHRSFMLDNRQAATTNVSDTTDVTLLADLHNSATLDTVFFLHYDYDDNDFESWYEDKDVVSLSPQVHQGYSSLNQGFSEKMLFRKRTGTHNKGLERKINPYAALNFRNDQFVAQRETQYPSTYSGSSDTLMSRYFFVFDYEPYPPWYDRGSLAFTQDNTNLAPPTSYPGDNLPLQLPAGKRRIDAFQWTGISPYVFKFGPEYELVSGEDLTSESSRDYDLLPNETFDRNFFRNPNVSQYGLSSYRYMRERVGSVSAILVNHVMDDVCIERLSGRCFSFKGDTLYLGEISTSQVFKKSDTQDLFLRQCASLPISDQAKRVYSIPLKDYNQPPTTEPFFEILREPIIHARTYADQLYLGTENFIFRANTNIENNTITPQQVTDRGIDSKMSFEGTTLYSSKSKHVFSVKYYEEAQGYQGDIENRRYDTGEIKTSELFVQDHNLGLFLEKDTNKIHLLYLGQDRTTEGFSFFELPDIVNNIRKLDDNRLLVMYRNNGMAILDFSDTRNRLDNGTDRFESTIRSAVIIATREDELTNVKPLRVNRATISMGRSTAPFNFSFIYRDAQNEEQKITKSVRPTLNSIDEVTELSSLLNLESLGFKRVRTPQIEISTDSEKDLRFSTLLVELGDN